MSDTLRQRIRQRLNLDPIPAILGDANGVVHEPNRNGYVRVRIREGGATYGAYKVVRLRGVLQPVPGKPVLLQYDADGELAVRETDFAGATAAGYNVSYDNPADRSTYRFVRQSDLITAMVAPTNPASMKLQVSPFVYRKQRKVYVFEGGLTTTLTAPSAGEHRAAVVGVKIDNTLEVVYSTSQSVAEDLDETDIQECLDALSEGAIPLWAWRVYGGQTSITLEDSVSDLRQFLDTDLSGVWTGTSAPTANDDKNDGYGLGALYIDTTNDRVYVCADNAPSAAVWREIAVGGGTVTSVGLSAPSIFTVTGSPITSSGTLTLALTTQSENTVFAGPASGSPAAPTFRGITSADLTTALTTPPPIGNTTPAAVWTTNLNIRPTTADGFRITREAANNLQRFYQYGAGTNIFEAYKAGGTEAAPTATVAGNTSFLITAYGHTGTAFTGAAVAAIRLRLSENTTASTHGSEIVFETTRNGTTTRASRLTLSGGGLFTSLIEDVATSTIVPVWTINTRSAGTPAAGFGAGFLFNLKSSTTDDRNAGNITVDWATATDASRSGRITLRTWYTTTARTGLVVQANSARAAIGFLGATPTEAPLWSAATGTASRASFDTATVTTTALAQAVKAIIDDLIAFGLFRTS